MMILYVFFENPDYTDIARRYLYPEPILDIGYDEWSHTNENEQAEFDAAYVYGL